MKRADVRFAWFTPDLGHEWKQKGRILRLIPKSGGSRFIDPNTPRGVWVYTPPPGLFRKFSRLRIDDAKVRRAEILAFANKYGDIIASPQEGHVTVSAEQPWGEVTRNHATMEQWCRTVQHMRRTVDLWDRINDPKRRGELQWFIVRSKDTITYRTVHHPLEHKADNDAHMVIAKGKDVAGYPPGDMIRPARRALRLEIRRAFTDAETPSHTTPGLTLELGLAMYPVNLLADMWMNFARVISGEIEERRCVTCPEHFYVGSGPGLRRADSVTCGDACRQRKKRREVEPRTLGHVGHSNGRRR